MTELTFPHASYAMIAFLVRERYRLLKRLTSAMASSSCLFDMLGRPSSASAPLTAASSSSFDPTDDDSNRTSSVDGPIEVECEKG